MQKISIAFAPIVIYRKLEVLTAQEGSCADVKPANTAAIAMNFAADNMVRC